MSFAEWAAQASDRGRYVEPVVFLKHPKQLHKKPRYAQSWTVCTQVARVYVRHKVVEQRSQAPTPPHPRDAGSANLMKVWNSTVHKQCTNRHVVPTTISTHCHVQVSLWWNGSLGKRGTLQLHAANCASVVDLATRRKTCRDSYARPWSNQVKRKCCGWVL